MVYLIFLLILLNLIIGIDVKHRFYKQWKFAHPFVWIYILYFLNYPLRAIVLIIDHKSSFSSFISDESILSALFYATSFFLISYSFFVLFCKGNFLPYLNDSNSIKYSYSFKIKIAILFYVLSFLYIVSGVYLLSIGKGYTQGENYNNSVQNFGIEYLIITIAEFKFFIFFLGIYSYQLFKSKRILVLIILNFSIFLLYSFISTSKGGIIIFLTIMLITFSLYKIKIRLIYFVIFAFVGLTFASYSYFVRYYGKSSGSFNISDLSNNISIFTDNYSEKSPISLYDPRGVFMFERFNYLDAIILIDDKIQINNNYLIGSILDLQGMIPRFLWYDKPKSTFGIYTANAVWGLNASEVVEMPIGRIGESFYLLKYIGLIFAPFLSLFLMFFINIYLNSKNIFNKSIFFAIFFIVIYTDGWFFYNYRTLIINIIIVYLISKLTSNNRFRKRIKIVLKDENHFTFKKNRFRA